MGLSEIILNSKGKIDITIEAEVIGPDVFAGKRKNEIEELPVWQGPVKLPLSAFFDVEVQETQGSGSSEETKIVIKGDVPRVKRIGQGMKAGKIEVLGTAGMHLGAEMAGGSILVKGDAGPWAGMEMKGGLIRIQGSAGDHAGSAYRGSWRGMTGGQILIEGNARSQLGGGLVGGQILVEGNVENFCAIRQSGGLILVKGSAVRGVGAEMIGGTAAVCGKISRFSPGFVETGREENPLLGDLLLEGRFVKFTGDFAISKNPKGSLYLKEV
jgi:formylmethanofuran dehydrogenase subunit C